MKGSTTRKLYAVCDERREVIALGSALGADGERLVDHLWRGHWAGARAAVTHHGDVRVQAYADVTKEAHERLGQKAPDWKEHVIDAEIVDD